MIGTLFAILLAAGPVRTVPVTITSAGFEPAKIEVKKGEKLRLVFTRKTEKTCATEVVFEGEKKATDLPLNKPVAVDFEAKKAGNVRYACGMNMIAGVITVQ